MNRALKSGRHLENMLKSIYQPFDYYRNNLRNQECSHSGNVRGLVLCVFISIHPPSGSLWNRTAVSSRSTKVTGSKTLPRLVSSCSAGKRLSILPESCLLPDPAQSSSCLLWYLSRKAETKVTVRWEPQLIHYICSGVWSSLGKAHTAGSLLSAHGHKKKVVFSEI